MRNPPLAHLLPALLVLAAACGGSAGGDGASAAAGSDTAQGPRPVTFTALGQVAPPELDESSGLVASAANPGVVWTMNDDSDTTLYALDTLGRERGRVALTGVRNVDWEALSLGPCGAQRCLYVGDIGDNDAVRASRTILRLPEPALAAGAQPSVAPESLSFRYADGPRDVEAMYVSRDGTVWLITKRPMRDAARVQRPALVYAIPASAWGTGERAVAALVDSLPMRPGTAPGRLITDAALSPDGRTIAVRTYGELYLLPVDEATGRPRFDATPRICDLTPIAERQGEGITFHGGAGDLLLSSEAGGDVARGVRSSLSRAKCQ